MTTILSFLGLHPILGCILIIFGLIIIFDFFIFIGYILGYILNKEQIEINDKEAESQYIEAIDNGVSAQLIATKDGWLFKPDYTQTIGEIHKSISFLETRINLLEKEKK